MSYGVALRNGVPFTLGTIAALCVNATGSAWSPLALWPNGISSAGMWISPRDLTSQWADYLGTTPVSTPGTVADSSNPVGLALDIRAGATVLTDPGNHMLQSTSVDRPLLSARVNLLTYTEDFSNAAWSSIWGVSNTATKLIATAANVIHGTRQTMAVSFGKATFTVVASAAEYSFMHLITAGGISPLDGVSFCATFDLTLGTVIKNGAWNSAASIVDLGGGVYECSAVSSQLTAGYAVINFSPTAATNTYLGDGVSGINVFSAQVSQVYTDYQSVPGDGSTYASGPPIAQLYDGVDDGMATAAFSAGTLIDGMDCMIAVRRDAGTVGIAGLSVVASAGYFFGFFHEPNNTDPNFGTVGTPTTWCDGVQLAGGTATTRATLYNALTAGDWHILEWRGLDLSGFTAAVFSAMTSGAYRFNGPRGDILLYPSTASTADKDAARQWLADYYGVTLP